jgi:hypothetical protein
MTVCLGVLCKYIPQFEFISVLLSDEPVMEPSTHYYQRLVARDKKEAEALALEYLETHTLEASFDDVLLPALHAAKRDYELGTLSHDDVQYIVQATRSIIDDLGTYRVNASPSATEPVDRLTPTPGETSPSLILGCPADDELDELALLMLAQLLNPQRYRLEVMSAEMLAAEVISAVEQRRADVLCIAAILPGALAPTRYLCKRLRSAFPECKIVVGLWGLEPYADKPQTLLREAGAHEVGTTLHETYNQLMHWSQLGSSLLSARSSTRPAE